MTSATSSSSDFAAVPAVQAAPLPARLIHRDVLGGASAEERRFSEQRNHLVHIVDLPSRVLSMTLGRLEPGQSTRVHRHNYETVLYILEGHGKSVIGETEVTWSKGDAVYVPVWAWHSHCNLSPSESALYIACENAPHLQNLGIALREEG
jgi:quercetin dioxygenase-like cupin family protein